MAERKVLIIDDDDALKPMLQTAFQRYKFKVLHASEGAEGLELARAEKPDLVLLSVELPVGNGFLVCKEFKQDADLKSIPIIITSRKATDADFDKHRKLKVRADDYLHKPFTDEELFQKVGNVVGFSLSPDEYSELEAKVHDFLEERGKLEAEIVEKSDRISQLEKELKEAKKSAGKDAGLQNDLRERDKQISSLEAALESERLSKEGAESSVKELQSRIEALESESQKISDRAEQSAAAEKRAEALEAKLAEANEALSQKEAAFAAEMGELQSQNERLSKQVAQLIEDHASVQTERDSLRDAIEKAQEAAGLSLSELAEAVQDWKTAADRVPELETELESVRAELDEAQAKNARLAELDSELSATRAELEDVQARASQVEQLEERIQTLEREAEKETKKRTKLREVLEKAIAALE